jgi:hypothetical protein
MCNTVMEHTSQIVNFLLFHGNVLRGSSNLSLKTGLFLLRKRDVR